MKIICTQENLKTALSGVGRIVSTSNTLPILSNLLLKTENGLLKISSTNLEIAITTQARCKVEQDGDVTVSGKVIMDLINNMPNKNIVLETLGGEMKIEAENYHTAIKTLPAEEFPLIPRIEGGETLVLDARELKNSLDKVVFAASTNQTQPEISGVMFGLDKTELRIVATDRYRLAEKKITLKSAVKNAQAVIIPQKTMVELSRVIGSQSGDVEVNLGANQIGMVFKDIKIISRLIDGQYPDYEQIIPESFATTSIVPAQALVKALRAAAVFSQSGNSVKFEFSQERQILVVAAESQELGGGTVEIPAAINGPGGQVIFNYHYVLDCLTSLESDNVNFKMINDDSPALMVPEGVGGYIYLVMPIKT